MVFGGQIRRMRFVSNPLPFYQREDEAPSLERRHRGGGGAWKRGSDREGFLIWPCGKQSGSKKRRHRTGKIPTSRHSCGMSNQHGALPRAGSAETASSPSAPPRDPRPTVAPGCPPASGQRRGVETGSNSTQRIFTSLPVFRSHGPLFPAGKKCPSRRGPSVSVQSKVTFVAFSAGV